jgi:GNAT superfamily N-acetyltransferase
MDIVIAHSSDATELACLEIESKRASIPHLVDPVEVNFTLRQQRWTTYFQAISPVGSKTERLVLKALRDGALVGFIAGHLTSRYAMDSEIQSFYVLRDHQRKGVGSALLAALADWLVGQGVRSLCVGIAAENPYRAFYLKRGARYLNDHWMYWSDVSALTNYAVE